MKPRTYISVFLMIIVLISVVTPSSARIFDRIIAFVNDDVITKRRLDLLVKERAFELQHIQRYSEAEAVKEAEKERSVLLDRLIREMLLKEAALTLKVQVTDAEIEEKIDKVLTQYQIPSEDEFKKILNRDGMTLVAYREQLKRNLMAEKLVMGRILPRLQVRDSDVQEFYEENRDQLPTKADRVSLRQIFIAYKQSDANKKATADTANKVLEEVKSDKTQFEIIAKRVATKHNNSAQAGALIESTPAELLSYPNAFLTALAKLKDGEISDLIEAEDGFHIFMVETRNEEKIMFRRLTIPFIFSEEAMQVSRDSAVEVVKKLDAGEAFAELAKANSDDSITREKGGNLGTHAITDLNPKIREIIESMEVGEYSKPFETELGIYIYKVDERKIPELTQQEKQQIIGVLRQQHFEKEWTAYTDSLMENAYIKIKPDAVPTQISEDN